MSDTFTLTDDAEGNDDNNPLRDWYARQAAYLSRVKILVSGKSRGKWNLGVGQGSKYCE